MERHPHGLKRHAEENLDNEQRLAKRLSLLNLDRNGKLYIPVQQPPPSNQSSNQRPSEASDDFMQLDDTKDKVYIYNLDDELADDESEEEKVVFLPDIERRLTKIPKSILRGQDQPQASSELVLYQVPSSLSVPREQDNVRKAILESRARAREKQAREAQLSGMNGSTASGIGNGIGSALDRNGFKEESPLDSDSDAMDLG